MGVLKELKHKSIGHLMDTTNNKSINQIHQLINLNQESKAEPCVYFTAVDGVGEKDYFNWTQEVHDSISECDGIFLYVCLSIYPFNHPSIYSSL